MTLSLNRRTLTLSLAVVIAAGCATAGILAGPAASLQRGDPKARVMEALGAPGDRQFSGDDEALQYCRRARSTLEGTEGEFTVVWLYKERVTGVTTYREVLGWFSGCASAFRTVNWAQAPSRDTAPPAERR